MKNINKHSLHYYHKREGINLQPTRNIYVFMIYSPPPPPLRFIYTDAKRKKRKKFVESRKKKHIRIHIYININIFSKNLHLLYINTYLHTAYKIYIFV